MVFLLTKVFIYIYYLMVLGLALTLTHSPLTPMQMIFNNAYHHVIYVNLLVINVPSL